MLVNVDHAADNIMGIIIGNARFDVPTPLTKFFVPSDDDTNQAISYKLPTPK